MRVGRVQCEQRTRTSRSFGLRRRRPWSSWHTYTHYRHDAHGLLGEMARAGLGGTLDECASRTPDSNTARRSKQQKHKR